MQGIANNVRGVDDMATNEKVAVGILVRTIVVWLNCHRVLPLNALFFFWFMGYIVPGAGYLVSQRMPL